MLSDSVRMRLAGLDTKLQSAKSAEAKAVARDTFLRSVETFKQEVGRTIVPTVEHVSATGLFATNPDLAEREWSKLFDWQPEFADMWKTGAPQNDLDKYLIGLRLSGKITSAQYRYDIPEMLAKLGRPARDQELPQDTVRARIREQSLLFRKRATELAQAAAQAGVQSDLTSNALKSMSLAIDQWEQK